jgi:hypothetical protein
VRTPTLVTRRCSIGVIRGARLRLFALQATSELGEPVAQALGQPLAKHEERQFEDGEHKTRPLDPVCGADVYVAQSLHGGRSESANDKLCRLLFFIGALKDAWAARVTAVVPHLCYARKDRRTKPNDPVITHYVASLFGEVVTDTFVTVPLLHEDYLILSTIHSAKGQEWKSVFVLNLVDGCIPTDLGSGTSAEIEEERRLLYVAMTRAKDDLHSLCRSASSPVARTRKANAVHSQRAARPLRADSMAHGGIASSRTACERGRARRCRRPHARHAAMRRTGLCAISIR